MSEVDKLAQRLLEAEREWRFSVINGWMNDYSRPRLDRLWPKDQERYRRMAEAVLGVDTGSTK